MHPKKSNAIMLYNFDLNHREYKWADFSIFYRVRDSVTVSDRECVIQSQAKTSRGFHKTSYEQICTWEQNKHYIFNWPGQLNCS